MNSHFKKFVSFYRPYLGQFTAVMVASLLATALMLVFPLYTRSIVQTALEGELSQAMPSIWRGGLALLLIILGQLVCNFYQDYMGHAMGAKMERDMREELFAHYQKLSFRFYGNRRVGELMSRLTGDLEGLSEMYHHVPEDIVLYFVRFVGAVVILFSINARLTGVVLLFLPPMLLFAFFFNKKMRAAARKSREQIGNVNAQAEDTLSGIRVVQSFTGEGREQEKFSQENNRFFERRKDIYRTESYLYQGTVCFIQLITAALIVFGGLFIVGGSMDPADLLAFLLYVSYLTEPVQHLLFTISQYQEGMAGFDRFMEIMELTPDIANRETAKPLGRARGEVAFDRVSFRYRAEGPDVLKNVSLTAKAGERVALVGASGVGKTTLCSLIPRFYDVTAGSVKLDGIDVRDITLDSLRENIGVVQQDVYIFSSTVLENLRYGKPQATREEIEAAARLAGAHDFIQSLPQGYDTYLGPRGVQLSGGQKQRLSIARVFLKNPPVLVLDEATSALDTESEQVIQASLDKLAQNRTTLVIAHRLSTIRSASRILVLEDSEVKEQGTHQELLTQGGVYARLWNAQTKA